MVVQDGHNPSESTVDAPTVITVPKVRSPLLPYQQQWLADQHKVKVYEKSRRIGITFAEAAGVASSRLSGSRDEDYWFSSADESAALEFNEYVGYWSRVLESAVDQFTDHYEDEATGAKTTAYVTRFPSGKRCTVMSSNPRRFRSKGGDVFLDEFGFHDQAAEMLKAAAPCTVWGGRLGIVSTHNGEGSKFNELVKMGMRRREGTPRPGDMPVSLHRTTLMDAIDQGLVGKINETKGTNKTHEEFVAECRGLCATEDAWLQEFMCVPSAETEAFLPYELLNTCVRRTAPHPTDEISLFVADVQTYGADAVRLYAGADIGRTNDRFSLWVLAAFGARLDTVGILTWKGRPFAQMEQAIAALMGLSTASGGRLRRLCIDATGLGMQLAERAAIKYPSRAEGVTFTAPLKEHMATSIKVRFDEGTISIPDDLPTKEDLHSIRKQVTAAGNIRYAGERTKDGHADRFWSLALADHAFDANAVKAKTVKVMGGE